MKLSDFCVFTEPQQGADYDTLLAVAQRAESLEFGGFFRSDHYLTMGGSGLPGPTDAWITLAGLARETSTIRLGTLVSPVTFRDPGLLAISVAQVDAMSGGRVELGLGTGWYDAEHAAYGFKFPALGARFDIFAEQLAIVRGLWETPVGETFSFSGAHYTLTDSPALPKPVQRPVPIIIGGGGKKRTPMLTAQYGNEFNSSFQGLSGFIAGADRVRAACAAIGRTDLPRMSAGMVVVCGENEATFERRAAAIGREPADLRANGACGTVDEVAATLRSFAEAGAERIYLQVLDLHDLDHLDVIAAAVESQR